MRRFPRQTHCSPRQRPRADSNGIADESSFVRYGRVALWSAALLAVGSFACQQPATRFADGTDSYAMPAWAPPEFATPTPVPVARRPLPATPAPAPAAAVNFPRSWEPSVAARPWRYIVIHHSATPAGSALEFDKLHRKNNGWDELGYHFVIGNGTDTQAGAIEVGPRWPKQKHGAHAKTDDNRFNNFGIGICLVGNFDTANPTPEQMRSLTVLVAYLMQKYDIPPHAVIGHQDTGKATACPGQLLEGQLPNVRRLAARAVANGFAANATATAPQHALPLLSATP